MLDQLRKYMYNPVTPAIACVAGVLIAGSLVVTGAYMEAALLFGVAALVTVVSTVLNYPRYAPQMKKLMSALCAVMVVFYCADLCLLSEEVLGTAPGNSGSYQPAQDHDHGHQEEYPEEAYYPEDEYDPGYGYEESDEPDCGVCHDSGMCSACNGYGGSACASCRGGHCKYCHGSGKTSSYGVDSRCGACSGTGKCKLCNRGIRECGICYGSGRCKYCR